MSSTAGCYVVQRSVITRSEEVKKRPWYFGVVCVRCVLSGRGGDQLAIWRVDMAATLLLARVTDIGVNTRLNDLGCILDQRCHLHHCLLRRSRSHRVCVQHLPTRRLASRNVRRSSRSCRHGGCGAHTMVNDDLICISIHRLNCLHIASIGCVGVASTGAFDEHGLDHAKLFHMAASCFLARLGGLTPRNGVSVAVCVAVCGNARPRSRRGCCS
mmetsp:Transcript_17287/g.46857  ORF Transcript_17287/g.46857 Transcript_17287/m.46857 type:complete len:214 (+) Transcript_17287:155-796(+)